PLLVGSGLLSMWGLGLDALVRDVAPERGFSRMMTLNTAGLMTAQGLGFALAGALAQAVGPATAIAIAGGCGLLVVLLLRPRVRDAPAATATTAAPALDPALR